MPGTRFPRRARLLLPREFDTVFQGGRRERGRFFVCVVAAGVCEHAAGQQCVWGNRTGNACSQLRCLSSTFFADFARRPGTGGTTGKLESRTLRQGLTHSACHRCGSTFRERIADANHACAACQG